MLKSNSPDLQSYDVFGQGAHGDAGAALRVVMAVFGRGAGAGDVEVGPAGFVDEFTDDEGAGDGAAFPTPGVFNVRDVALVLLLVLGIFGQAAIPLAGLFPRGQQLIRQFVVVGDKAAVNGAEGDDARAGEGGHVDDGVGPFGLGVGDRVGQN